MELYKFARDGKLTLINGDNILTIDYTEHERQLIIKLINGETLTLDGDYASDAWERFNDEAVIDEREEDEETEEENPFEILNKEIAALEAQIKRRSVTRAWDADSLRRSADELDEYWNTKKKREYQDELLAVRERAYAVADEAETLVLVNRIDECITKPIVNSSSMKSILGQLNDAESELQRNGKLTDEIRQKIRSAKERIVWHRTKKKLSDADVALAGGNQSKSDKCKREAAMLIKQDWAEVFPDEEPQDIEKLSS